MIHDQYIRKDWEVAVTELDALARNLSIEAKKKYEIARKNA